MRVTDTMMMSNYKGALSDSLDNLNDSMTQMSTQRRFQKVSDDPAAAMKTLRSMRNLSSDNQLSDTLSEATAKITDTESTVSTVNDIVKSVQSTLNRANSSATASDDDIQTYITTLQSYQGELVQTLNSTYSGNYVFGGTDSGSKPFQVGSDGQLQIYDYNGAMTGTAQYVDFDDITTSLKDQMDLSSPVDVGLGIQLDGSGKVVSGTAFETATSSIGMLSVNMDDSDTSKNLNLYGVISNAITKLQAGGTADLDDEIAEMKTAQSSVLNTSTILGQKSNMLSFLSDRNTTITTNETSRLSSVMDVDMTSAITQYETSEMVYQATLSAGTKVLQSTLFDFLK